MIKKTFPVKSLSKKPSGQRSGAQGQAARQREDERNRPKASGADANYRSGNRVLADLLGGLLGGAVIGYAIGHFTDTNPWGLLVGLFLGIVVAFRNIIRAANQRPDE